MTRVACQQLAPRVGALAENRVLAARAIEAAARAGADVVVLPELVTSGYVFADAAEARACAEPADGPSLRQWAELAAAHDLVIAAGFAEDAGDRLYNSAALVDPAASAPSTARRTCGATSRTASCPARTGRPWSTRATAESG